MSDLKETCVNYVGGDDYITFCSSEKRWISKITRLHEQRPDEVTIVHQPEDNDGMLYAYLPKSWLKVSPPRQVNYTDEQREAMAERLAAAREKKAGE